MKRRRQNKKYKKWKHFLEVLLGNIRFYWLMPGFNSKLDQAKLKRIK